jgi:hypothetical protein
LLCARPISSLPSPCSKAASRIVDRAQLRRMSTRRRALPCSASSLRDRDQATGARSPVRRPGLVAAPSLHLKQ